VSVSTLTNIGVTKVVTYSVPAPGGYWDSTDNGAYTITVQPNQVKDTSGNAALQTAFTPITASSPAITSLGVKGVQVNGSSGNDTMRFDVDANYVYFNLNDSTLYLLPASVGPSFIINALAGDDSIVFQSGRADGVDRRRHWEQFAQRHRRNLHIECRRGRRGVSHYGECFDAGKSGVRIDAASRGG